MSSVEIIENQDLGEENKDDLEKGNMNTFTAVPTSDEELHEGEKKMKDIRWTNVNFKVKNKVILSDCWGEVSIIASINTSVADVDSILSGKEWRDMCNYGTFR